MVDSLRDKKFYRLNEGQISLAEVHNCGFPIVGNVGMGNRQIVSNIGIRGVARQSSAK